jgi:[ribosomal protein S5]-alanine N-acetyltransferase
LPFFQGEKVRLRSVDENDLKELFEWENSPEARGDYSAYRPISWQDFESKNKNWTGVFLIEELQSRKKIGTVLYFADDHHPYRIWLAYTIAKKEYRGKGYATEAARLLIDFLFNNKNIEKIETTVDVSNVASQKVLEKNGFQREGTLRHSYFVNGKFNDHYYYGLIRKDWQEFQDRLNSTAS